jgi:hypothetical protein
MPSCRIMICTALSADALRRRASFEERAGLPCARRRSPKNSMATDRIEAARLAGMSDQALRDAIKRYNPEGIDGRETYFLQASCSATQAWSGKSSLHSY